MLKMLFDYAPRALALLPPEEAHEVTLKSLELGVFPAAPASDDASLAVAFAHLSLPNPVGIAAGFDKDARVPDAILRLGCGFAEIGTVTPLPQLGNPSPRVFRLPRDRAVINRLGFNNARTCSSARPAAQHAAPAWSASTSAPTRMRQTASPITCAVSRHSTTSPVTSRSTYPRPTRRDCATCRIQPRSRSCCSVSSRHAQTDGCRQAEAADCRQDSRPTSPNAISAPSSCNLLRRASTASPSPTRRSHAAG